MSPRVFFAQADEETINRILMAAPERLRADVAVIGWRDDGARVTIRSGSNGVVCWDQSDEPRKRTYASRCTSEANLPRVEQNRSWVTSGKSQEEIQEMMTDAEENGSREVSEFGTVYYSVNTDDPDNASIHLTISVPHGTSQSLGVPSESNSSNVWLMGEGTSGAHLMIPGR